jgi:hypothetical protein
MGLQGHQQAYKGRSQNLSRIRHLSPNPPRNASKNSDRKLAFVKRHLEAVAGRGKDTVTELGLLGIESASGEA